MQYHGGIVFGKAVNKPRKLANIVLRFMLVCLFGGPKFLCRMLFVKELDAIFFFEKTHIIIKGVKQVGREFVAITCDGNRINQSLECLTHILKSHDVLKIICFCCLIMCIY